ncbi:MAG TPA: CsgG/HfaB family protein, partial [Vicinamibacterales bacterium]
MKTITRAVYAALSVAISAVAVLVAQTPVASTPASSRKPRIAVVDFDYATVYGGVAAIFGTNVDVGKGVSDLLVNYLVKDGSYSVIERAALDKIMAEQNFSNS